MLRVDATHAEQNMLLCARAGAQRSHFVTLCALSSITVKTCEKFLSARNSKSAGDVGTAEWFPAFFIEKLKKRGDGLPDSFCPIQILFKSISQEICNSTGLFCVCQLFYITKINCLFINRKRIFPKKL